MGMFGLWKCPRCWDNPCHCDTDAYGDQVNRNNNQSVLNELQKQTDLLKKSVETTERLNQTLAKRTK